jgi:hypothetical protein
MPLLPCPGRWAPNFSIAATFLFMVGCIGALVGAADVKARLCLNGRWKPQRPAKLSVSIVSWRTLKRGLLAKAFVMPSTRTTRQARSRSCRCRRDPSLALGVGSPGRPKIRKAEMAVHVESSPLVLSLFFSCFCNRGPLHGSLRDVLAEPLVSILP